ncbi:MAG: hypothetical protein ACD_65C00201G0003 [uncultured bacterium]|nr:MAG: hypothetical protein ACD_65C00201G0003 [uncultured bacterium]
MEGNINTFPKKNPEQNILFYDIIYGSKTIYGAQHSTTIVGII